MGKIEKTLLKILSGTSDSNLPFRDLCRVMAALGFSCRIKGSHHIFFRDGVEEIFNLQPRGSKAKAYQVKQIRQMILKYRLGGSLHEQV